MSFSFEKYNTQYKWYHYKNYMWELIHKKFILFYNSYDSNYIISSHTIVCVHIWTLALYSLQTQIAFIQNAINTITSINILIYRGKTQSYVECTM